MGKKHLIIAGIIFATAIIGSAWRYSQMSEQLTPIKPAVCGNGVSETGETPENCPDDCVSEYFLLGDIEKLKEKANDKSPGNIGISSATIFEGIKEKANLDLKNGVKYISEPKSGGAVKKIGDTLLSHALVYKITGEKKYLNRAISIMKNVSKWKKWNHIYANDDMNSLDRDVTLVTQGLAYNWLYYDLDATQRKTIRSAIINKGILPINKCFIYKKWPFNEPGNNNHYIAGAGALGLGSLIALSDEPKMEEPLQNAIAASKLFIEKSGGKDGGYPESVSYGSFSLLNLDIFNQALKDSKGIDLLEFDSKDWIRKFNMFIIYSFYPDASSVVLFNDQLSTTPTEQLMRCARIYDGSDIAQKCQLQLKLIYEKEQDNFKYNVFKYNVFSFLDYDPHRPIGSFDDLDNFKIFRDIGHAFYHEDWNDKNSLFIAFKAERHNSNFMTGNTAHLHTDGGQFVIYKNRNEYITDLGYQLSPKWDRSQTYKNKLNILTKTSLGHNNMLFDGEYQQAYESRITDAISENRLLYLKMDLKNSYPTVDLDEYNREFILLSDSTLITIDTFYGKNLRNYTYRLQLAKREKNGAKFNKVIINGLSFNIVPYQNNAPDLYGKILYPSNIRLAKKKVNAGGKSAEFIEENGNFISDSANPHYLVNLFTFSDAKFILEDKGNHFFITDGVQKIHFSKQGNIQVGEHFGKAIITGKDGKVLLFVEEN